MIFKVLVLLGAGLVLTAAFHLQEKRKLTNSCVKCHDTDPDKINVHLIHHSHDDVGWLKTVDQYYWGLNYSIQHVGVQYIMTSVANALEDYPDRRFIQVETAFFWMWWENQDDVMRNKFKKLVDNGQIEIVNGAWSMNDEACVNYQSIIDQFTWGFKMLSDTLGECGVPTIGWQIDPFGHSREHGSIMTKLALDGLFFGRLDQYDRKARKEARNMEFLWKTSANDDSLLFGGAFGAENTYHTPSGLCFDILCSDDSINDNPEVDGYNLNVKMASLEQNVKDYAAYYRTNNVLITLGGDFYYQAAEINFQNSDKLIKGFQDHQDLHVIYSTPACYLKSVYESEPTLETKIDDFFPYSTSEHNFWVGYFSSRQNFKRFERISHNILQIAKQLTAIGQASGQNGIELNAITKLRQASGVVQHHDAITGTEKQHVTNDYLKMVSEGISDSEEQISRILSNLLELDNTDLSSCLLTNMSICSVSQSADKFIVVLYNPLSWPVDHVIRLPVQDGSYTIRGMNDEYVASDVVEPISDFSYANIDGATPAKNELVFIASDIPPLGVKSFYIVKGPSESARQNATGVFKFGNEDIGFELNSSTNLLEVVTMNGQSIEIEQKFWYYNSRNGTDGHVASGAYIFQPDNFALPFENPTITRTYQGEIVEEVQQKFNDWVTQIIRIYKGSQNYIEFDWLIGPADVSDGNGKEVITRFTVDGLRNNGTFYTDSNGREMIQRILNYRPTFSYDPTLEPVASNYYPVTSKISIRDEELGLQVSLLNDRAQGGSSLDEGQMELMVLRRTLKDDEKGVGEALNELEFGQGIVARGQHYLVIGPSSGNEDVNSVTLQERVLAQQKLLPPWIGLANANQMTEVEVLSLVSKEYSALKAKLPENVNILTLEPWTESRYLLRLEHIMEKEDYPGGWEDVLVNLADLFSDFTVENIEETTLGANRGLESATGYDWSYKTPQKTLRKGVLTETIVTLSPMDIRTFLIDLARK